MHVESGLIIYNAVELNVTINKRFAERSDRLLANLQSDWIRRHSLLFNSQRRIGQSNLRVRNRAQHVCI